MVNSTSSENNRVLAVDPGDQRIGIALSDPSATIANPHTVITHQARAIDAAVIGDIARSAGAVLIIVGIALDEDGEVGPRARKAIRLADAIKGQTDIPVELWDESGSTRIARESRLLLGVRKNARAGHHDALAAVVILQSYLDSKRSVA